MLRLTEANSTFTLLQSHSSSSASSIGRPEPVPWPISAIGQRSVTMSSGSMTTQAVTSRGRAASSPQYWALSTGVSALATPGAIRPNASPPASVLPVMTNWRRESSCAIALHLLAGSAMDRPADAHIGAAAADIGDAVDIGCGGPGRLVQRRDRRQNLARLAIAALRHILRHPRRLHRMRVALRGQAFDGGDGSFDGGHRRYARPYRLVVDQHGAGAALRDTAAIFGPGQPDLVAQRPQQRHLRLDIQLVLLAIDGERDHQC